MRWPPERTYFIADIGANHDGSLERALHLISLCASVGVDAVKFQHFRARQIVSPEGFAELKIGHQATWPDSVYETYERASLPWAWTERLAQKTHTLGMDFISTPYDLEAVDHLAPFVDAYKIGSGDLTWHALIDHAASKGKPVILGTGASNVGEIQDAVKHLPEGRSALLQCTSDYRGGRAYLEHANVRVLGSYAHWWPQLVLGLSDHSPNYSAVLPAITLGARIIEKHFTDNPKGAGPDHAFAMDPHIWHDTIERSREVEAALGDGIKRVEPSETESRIVQRRCIRAARALTFDSVIEEGDLEMLRPAPEGSIPPYELANVIGCSLATPLVKGEVLTWQHLTSAHAPHAVAT